MTVLSKRKCILFRFDFSLCNLFDILAWITFTAEHRKLNCSKMVNGFRYYRALESVSIASALSTALTICPCQIRVHQRWQTLNSNFLQLGRRSGGRPQRAVHPMRLPVNIVIHTTLVGLEPATFRSLVDCWFDALPVVPPTHRSAYSVQSNNRLYVQFRDE